MDPLDLVNLTPLMRRGSGRPEIVIGLIDGPIVISHPDLAAQNIREVPGQHGAICMRAPSTACIHGTFVAGVLCAKRGSLAPAIAPNCTLLLRPIFAEGTNGHSDMPSATPEELAAAIVDIVEAGARVINLSAALAQPSLEGERQLSEALDSAARRRAVVVAAAGNQGSIGSSAITRHPWVVPVVGCDAQSRPLLESNLGNSIGQRGLSAPGENITSLGTSSKPQTFGGTSAAAPFVTGAIALLWSEFPRANGAEIKLAITQANTRKRRTVTPPLLNAWVTYRGMVVASSNRGAR
jgi:subtilisin family serine protease